MSDAQLLWYDFGADVKIDNGDLLHDGGLASAVLISLFTDARAPVPEQLPDGETSMRGWWGDLPEIDTMKTGSLLWLIQREKVVPEVAQRAKEYAETALEWMVRDEIAGSVTVESQLVRPFGLQLSITIARGTSKQYSYLWEAVAQYSEMKVQNTSIKLNFV